MTKHDQAFFRVDGDLLVPSPLARGPWGSTISGTYVGGLLGWAVERVGGAHDLQPARLTVDLLRPVALADPVRVDTTVEREGRRIRLVDAAMRQNDTVVARASALFLRRAEQPPDPVWTLPIEMPPPPIKPVDVAGDFTMELWAYSANSNLTAPSQDLSEWLHGGQKYAWVRDVKPLVDGEAVTPFVRAAMAGDVTSSLTHSSASGLNFINADYTLTLSRLPDGEYIGLAALTHYSHAGVATGTAALFDQLGPIGSSVATGLVNPGFRPPSRGERG
jgi:acyl-CoA thioesterase